MVRSESHESVVSKSASSNGTSRRVSGIHFTSLTALSSSPSVHKIKARLRRAAHVTNDPPVDPAQEASQSYHSTSLDHNAAFGATHLVKGGDKPKDGTLSSPSHLTVSFTQAVRHPRKTLKKRIAGITAAQLSKADKPYISPEADRELLKAHDDLANVSSCVPKDHADGTTGHAEELSTRRSRVQALEDQRESLRAAWITTRHVKRVRVVPGNTHQIPPREDFVLRDEMGRIISNDWVSWLGKIILYYTQDFSKQYVDDAAASAPFILDTSRSYVERIVMASASWQTWLFRVRSVYMWRDPLVTAKWFALYLALWYMEHLATFLYSYIIYFVIRNRFYPTKLEDIRSALHRAMDRESQAHQFGELISKHGDQSWLDPVMDSVGPYIQIQLGDLADMLEILSNFYNWRYPRKTLASIFFLSICLVTSLLGDYHVCMKIIWLIAGLTFFLCWPISSRYPAYRHLVSPVKWVFWGIPTHAEWSFQYLRRHAQIARQNILEDKIDTMTRHKEEQGCDEFLDRSLEDEIANNEDSVNSSDHVQKDANSSILTLDSTGQNDHLLDSDCILAFEASYSHHDGLLVIFSQGIRFIHTNAAIEDWQILFTDLCEISKHEGKWASKVSSQSHYLQVQSIQGHNYMLKSMKKRDEAFNSIIGFSALQWQSLDRPAITEHSIPEAMDAQDRD